MPRCHTPRRIWAWSLLWPVIFPAGVRGEDGGLVTRISLAQLLAPAPTVDSDGQLVLDVTLNGVAMGPMTFFTANGRLLLPPTTAQDLRVRLNGPAPVPLDEIAGAHYSIRRQQGEIDIELPPAALTLQSLYPLAGEVAQTLSAETGGAYLDYDLNARHVRADGDAPATYGGFVSLHAFAPNLVASSSWSFDSVGYGPAGTAPVRLDTTVTYRPADRETSVSVGDLVSTPAASARPFRFTGVLIGSDHSAQPGWSPVPLPSITGTAQPTSSLDLYVNGIRSAQLTTTGGPFNLMLPAGLNSAGARLVVTDVTGRVVEIPFRTPRFNLDLIRQRVTLWSLGIGLPRFDWGAESNSYLHHAYAYGSWRHGISDRLTASVHGETGLGIVEAEAAITALLAPEVGIRCSLAGSDASSRRGMFASTAVIVDLPARLSTELSGGFATGEFNDAVSASGTAFDQQRGVADTFSRPLTRTLSARLSWEPRDRLSLSAAYDRLTYRGSPATAFASLTATAALANGTTLYASGTREFNSGYGTSVMLGLSVLLGQRTNASISTGRESDTRRSQATLVRPLGRDRGDYGWQLTADRGVASTYLNGEVELRTGYGIPAAGATSFAGRTQTYLRGTGSVGIAAWHSFASDPLEGGLVVADVGQPGVPLLLNGYATRPTGSDGKAVIAVGVAGAPQRIDIEDDDLPLDLIAGTTREIVTVRAGSGTVAHFSMQSAHTGAIVLFLVDGTVPPPGTSVQTAEAGIPIDSAGRAWLPTIRVSETLTVELADGRRCSVQSAFDGQGGPSRIIGPLDCRTTP